MRYTLLRGNGHALYDDKQLIAQWGPEEGREYVLSQVEARAGEWHEEAYRGQYFPRERPMLKIEKRGNP